MKQVKPASLLGAISIIHNSKVTERIAEPLEHHYVF